MSPFKIRSGTLFFVVFAFALLLPSSAGGAISAYRMPIAHLVCAGFIALTAFRMHPPALIKTNFLIGQLLLMFLLIFTLFSPLNQLALGAAIPYIGIVFVLSLNLRRWRPGIMAVRVFVFSAACLLILGWGTVLGHQGIIDLQQNYYQQFNDEMFEQMIVWYSKPVTVYATHSLSAFAYFALSVTFFRMANFEFRRWKRFLWMVYGFGFAFLIPCLMSNSAAMLTALLLLAGLFYLIKSKKWFVVAAVIIAGICAALVYMDTLIGLANSLFRLQEVLGSNTNGLASRYGSASRLQPTYDYLLENGGWPIGLSSDPKIIFGDNFIGEYVLRLTPVGYLAVLFMLYNFLVINLRGKLLPRAFFAFFLIADVSFPLLTSFRFVFMIPVVILMWRDTRVVLAYSSKPRSIRRQFIQQAY